MPHALLLSPDDQAVNAITGVLEEMSVTCDRPLDGTSAAQKLNAQSFDLVLVDCENLPAAKLIFDVCRRGKSGNNPVPIAIVDGRAGLPTAFRLGAELILTKPVAKDQARSTIRTAVSRVRKNAPTIDTATPQPPSSATAASATTASATTEERAQAAAAAAVSSQPSSYTESAPSLVPDFLPSAAPTAALTATPAVATPMNSAVDEIDAAPAGPSLQPESASFSATSLSEPSATGAVALNPEPPRPLPLSDDPVLAELQRAELEESQPAKSQPAPDSLAPVSSSPRQGQRKTRAPLVALLMMALAGGGFYAAWMYQPGFRTAVQPQIDGAMALVGQALPRSPAPRPARPSAQLAPAKPSESNPGAIRPSPDKNDSAKNTAAASPGAQLPGENSAIILSSRGAATRLLHSVAPKYPAETRSQGADGTVVLKAVVDENGTVQGLRLVEGDAALAAAATEAVKQWRYRPYVRDGKAQSFQTVVIVDFQRP